MKLDKAITQRSHLYFIVFFLSVIVAFWYTYFVRILTQENYRMHAHGAALILWCLMLIVQPYLIRTRQNALHKKVGKFSYVLVPVLLLTTYDLFRFRLHAIGMDYLFAALVLNALVAFVILYGLAIFYRKNSALHSRYMVSTVFTMFTPVTDRIINIHFPSLVPYLPTALGAPLVPIVGFAMADVILVGLCIWDWRSHKRRDAFPVALIILLIYHFSFLTFYKFQFWRDFSSWIMGF